jgi:hypothetical protein
VDRKRTNPKSHHYVPESYLWRFADTRGFQHIRDRARRQTRRQRQDQVMAINAYYCQTWAAQGVDPNIFEIELGKGLESEARGVIDKLIMSPQSLNEYDTASLLNYLEVQRIRVPRQAETAKVLMRDAILNSAPTDVVARITAGHLQLTMKDSARFEYMAMAVGSIYPWLGRMEWEIFEARTGTAFITTDSPVSFFNPRILPPAEARVGLAGTKVLFPLSSRKLLLMRHPECRSEPPLTELPPTKLVDGLISVSQGVIWDRDRVELTNLRMAHLAHELIVGESEDVLKSLSWEDSQV